MLIATIKDTPKIMEKLQDYIYAQKLYAAWCNILWFHIYQPENTRNPDTAWSVTWRTAGRLVANLRGLGENYMAFYCSGIRENEEDTIEGTVDNEISEDLLSIGWEWQPYPDIDPNEHFDKEDDDDESIS